MKIAICDDEPVQTEYLTALVKKWAAGRNRKVVTEAFGSAEAFEFAWSEDKSYDALLLDIQMPGQNGMELARDLRRSGEPLAIVFITGYSDYMDQGYDVDALHYLLKPVDEGKLFSVLDKAASKAAASVRRVLLPSAGGGLRLPADDILYAEAFSHTVELHTVRQVFSLKTSMNELETSLGEGFFRCHRSYIVGLKHVRRVTRCAMVLDTAAEIPLSRKLYDSANQAFIRSC